MGGETDLTVFIGWTSTFLSSGKGILYCGCAVSKSGAEVLVYIIITIYGCGAFPTPLDVLLCSGERKSRAT